MKLAPWKQQSSAIPRTDDFEQWMKDVFDFEGFRRHLPEVFRKAPMPAINLAETEKEFVATVELPGLDEKDVEVQILGDQLVITGERKWEESKKTEDYYRVESQYGSFRRAIELPQGLMTAPDKIDATFDKGMLDIRIPKAEPRIPAKVKVKSVR